MNICIRIALALALVAALVVVAQPIIIDPDGQVTPLVTGPRTLLHVANPYLKEDGSTAYRHHYIYADTITGLGGPFPMDENGGSNSWRMAMYTLQERYPTVYLPSLGTADENLNWATAVYAVMETNPGGIVELEEWLP